MLSRRCLESSPGYRCRIRTTGVLLPKGFCLASAHYLKPSNITAVTDTPLCVLSALPYTRNDNVFLSTIEDSLAPRERGLIYKLGCECKHAFEVSSSTLDKAKLVNHLIGTGDAVIVRHRPFRVSLTEHRTYRLSPRCYKMASSACHPDFGLHQWSLLRKRAVHCGFALIASN